MILRHATAADVPLLRRWDKQAHVVAARGNAGGYNWELDLPRNVSWGEFLIAEHEGRPIGFLQIIDPALEESHYWGAIEPNLRALDIWIGEERDLGRGFGTHMMRLALGHCFAREAVRAVIIDPLRSNVRALKFYERTGFRPIGERRFGPDDCLVMRLEREVWARQCAGLAFAVAPAEEGDIPAIAAILNDAILHSTAVWYDVPKSEMELRDWLGGKQRDGLPVLVARNEHGVAIGYASYGPFRPWPGYRLSVEHSVYVSKDARRMSIGKTLLSRLMERARAAGLHVMIGGIEAENAASLALHRKLGFVETARLPEVGQKFGRWLTLVFLQKTL